MADDIIFTSKSSISSRSVVIQENEKTEETKGETYTPDEATNTLGVGLFQVKLIILSGFVWTWIDIKSEAKNKAAERTKYMKKTGGGAPCEPLPPLLEKITTVIDPVMITGDCDVEETGRVVEDFVINANEEGSKDATSTPLIMENVEMPAPVSMFCTPSSSSHKRGPNRKLSSRDFSNLMKIENEKAEALKSIAVSLAKANELKEMELEAYKERTSVFINIANAFLEK